jgi:hypothetical protein
VDEFRDYLDKRGDNASDAASAAASSGRNTRKASSSQKSKATAKKDALDDALGDLNKSTNRLRRKFDATDKWMETKGQVQSVLMMRERSTRRSHAAAMGPKRAGYGACSARASTIWRARTAFRRWHPDQSGPARTPPDLQPNPGCWSLVT